MLTLQHAARVSHPFGILGGVQQSGLGTVVMGQPDFTHLVRIPLVQKEDETVVATYGKVVEPQGEGLSLHFPNRKVVDSFLYRNFVSR